jgi:hypothetical protein
MAWLAVGWASALRVLMLAVVQIHSFLTLALDGSALLASCPGRFTCVERAPCTYCREGWVGPRAGLDVLQKIKICWLSRNSNPGSSSPYSSH